jgi:hypothetical protein
VRVIRLASRLQAVLFIRVDPKKTNPKWRLLSNLGMKREGAQVGKKAADHAVQMG